MSTTSSVFHTLKFLPLLTTTLLLCTLPENPSDPKNATFNAVFRTSDGQIHEHSVVDTLGQTLEIGVSLLLPENFDSVRLVISAETELLRDTILKGFRRDARTDTVWLEYVFTDAGVKKVTITPFTDLDQAEITANITIVAKKTTKINNAPKWSVDTITVSLTDTSHYSLLLPDICVDPDGDSLFFSLIAGPPGGDTIQAGNYFFNATGVAPGPYYPRLTAADGSGAVDTLIISLTISVSYIVDTVPPTITLVSPSSASSISTTDSCIISVICNDASGINSVDALFDGNRFLAAIQDGKYVMTVKGLKPGTGNDIVITATDASAKANKTSITLGVTYDKPHIVIYNGNGNTAGSVPVDVAVYSEGTVVTVRGNSGNLVKTGAVFTGWNTRPDGAGLHYASGDTLVMAKTDVMLYARWAINTYTLTYVGNNNTGGSVPPTLSPYDSNATIVIASNTGNLTRIGYTFDGWNTTANGTGAAYVVGATLKIRSDTTLYAQWSIKQYTVTYLGNNQSSGSAPDDGTPHDSNTTVTVTSNTGNLVKGGYRFAGWNTMADGSGITYAIGSSIQKIGSDTTLYALWIKKCTITYLCNNCTSHYSGTVPDAVSFDSNTTTNVANNTGNLKRDAYIFMGWNTTVDGRGTYYPVDSTISIISNLTLYPKWAIMDADSNIYTEVTIGTQVWMVENLKTTKYRTGASIRLVEDSTTWWNAFLATYCWYENNQSYKEPFGALYNWYTVNSGMLAPNGWRVPNNNDWRQLIAAAGGEDVAGSHLKAVTHWGMPDIGKEDNSTGFSALPGGGRYYTGRNSNSGFLGAGDSFGFWWSSETNDDTTAWNCSMALYNTAASLSEVGLKFHGLSVRCIRDY